MDWHGKSDAPVFLRATPAGVGAVATFHFYGDDATLGGMIDASVRGRGRTTQGNVLENNELRYGILTGDDGDALDEVLVAKPMAGMRVLMCHGGVYICERIEDYFSGRGARHIDLDYFEKNFGIFGDIFDPVLAGCLTATQAAMALSAREAWTRGERAALPAALLATHHVCLAGPPNAGKSSLLNRLSGFERAFVHEEAGATRDVVGELVELAGYAALVEDLPGFSRHGDAIMRAAREKALCRLSLAGVAAFVCDASRGWDGETDDAARMLASALRGPRTGREAGGGEAGVRDVIVVLNKADLRMAIHGTPWERHFPGAPAITACSLPGGDAAEAFALAFHRLMSRGVEG